MYVVKWIFIRASEQEEKEGDGRIRDGQIQGSKNNKF